MTVSMMPPEVVVLVVEAIVKVGLQERMPRRGRRTERAKVGKVSVRPYRRPCERVRARHLKVDEGERLRLTGCVWLGGEKCA